jgi:hypothetical protein
MALATIVKHSDSENRYTLRSGCEPVSDAVEVIANDFPQEIFNDSYPSKDYFFWNVFANNRIYITIPANVKISIKEVNFDALFKKYYHPSSSNNFCLRVSHSTGVTWAHRYKIGSYDGWMISKNLFFAFDADFSKVGVCSHFTGTVNNLYIRSKGYQFANTSSFDSCSHPSLQNPSSPLFPCPYSSNHSSCPYYSLSSETLASKSITSFESTNSTSYLLTVSTSLTGQSIYQIIKHPDNEVNYTILVDSRTEETDQNALEVYDEIISSYNDAFKTIVDIDSQNDKSQKNSFILSLV